LRTIGKYVGIVRGYAKEFRAQWDEALRESELAELKKDVENIAQETEASLSATGQSVEKSFADARQSVEGALGPDPFVHEANGLPVPTSQPAPAEAIAAGANGASPAPEAPVPDAPPAAEAPPAEPGPAATAPAPEKTGA
jgi:sec-independent protein translocase protein TatB